MSRKVTAAVILIWISALALSPIIPSRHASADDFDEQNAPDAEETPAPEEQPEEYPTPTPEKTPDPEPTECGEFCDAEAPNSSGDPDAGDEFPVPVETPVPCEPPEGKDESSSSGSGTMADPTISISGNGSSRSVTTSWASSESFNAAVPGSKDRYRADSETINSGWSGEPVCALVNTSRSATSVMSTSEHDIIVVGVIGIAVLSSTNTESVVSGSSYDEKGKLSSSWYTQNTSTDSYDTATGRLTSRMTSSTTSNDSGSSSSTYDESYGPSGALCSQYAATDGKETYSWQSLTPECNPGGIGPLA